jgi:hypothetical protein
LATSTSVELLCVAPAQIRQFWPHVAHLLRAAILRTGLSDWQEVEDSILDGDALLWLAWDGAQIKSAASTSLTAANGRLSCTVVACGGDDMSQWLGLLSEIEKYAKAEGCDCTRIIGRKGWLRALKDYRMTNVVLERAL